MPIDHFAGSSTSATFPNRYWINSTYWEKGGPVFRKCPFGGSIFLCLIYVSDQFLTLENKMLRHYCLITSRFGRIKLRVYVVT